MQQRLSFKTVGHNNGSWYRFFYFLACKIIRFRWQAVLLIVPLTAFFAYQMQGLVFDNSNEIWFVKGDRTLEIMDKFKATFGNDEFVFILFDTEDFFQPDTIRRIGRLADDLEAHVPYVKDMTWLGNVEHIEGIKGGVEIHELIKNVPDTAEEMAKIKEKALIRLISWENRFCTTITTIWRTVKPAYFSAFAYSSKWEFSFGWQEACAALWRLWSLWF